MNNWIVTYYNTTVGLRSRWYENVPLEKVLDHLDHDEIPTKDVIRIERMNHRENY